MYNLLCVLIKINRQSITCPLVEVFTTIHGHGGRTLAQETHCEKMEGFYNKVAEKRSKIKVPLGECVCLYPELQRQTDEKFGRSLQCPLVSGLHITVLCVMISLTKFV